ncbi:MAG: phosphodiester glycosidase family protein [Thalassovita sp.]|nr:phosphodiester glycosidase family protein [Thalassovita sp.]
MIPRRAFTVLAVALSLLTSLPASALTCRDITFDGHSYTICETDPAQEDLRLFLRDSEGRILGQFNRVDAALPDDESLVFAMNAGMFHPDRSPVGYYLENGHEERRVFTNAGPGNFHLLPNGVFCIGEQTARVFESRAYLEQRPGCRYATQSGPMLVIDGDLHPRFLADSNSQFIRNGVGTTETGDRVVFAISNDRVTFHQFGRLFRDALKLPQALYFDGKVSRLYAPTIGHDNPGLPLGPMVGIVAPR